MMPTQILLKNSYIKGSSNGWIFNKWLYHGKIHFLILESKCFLRFHSFFHHLYLIDFILYIIQKWRFHSNDVQSSLTWNLISLSKRYKYMTAQEAAERWKISVRRIQRLCKENRIEGVLNVNRVWLIPQNSKKPVDKRRKVTNYGE